MTHMVKFAIVQRVESKGIIQLYFETCQFHASRRYPFAVNNRVSDGLGG